MAKSKVWWQSRTVWVNIIAVAAAVVLLASQQLELTSTAVNWLLFIWGALNLVLRALTDKPISLK